jgi:hypothetical protein
LPIAVLGALFVTPGSRADAPSPGRRCRKKSIVDDRMFRNSSLSLTHERSSAAACCAASVCSKLGKGVSKPRANQNARNAKTLSLRRSRDRRHPECSICRSDIGTVNGPGDAAQQIVGFGHLDLESDASVAVGHEIDVLK